MIDKEREQARARERIERREREDAHAVAHGPRQGTLQCQKRPNLDAKKTCF